MKLGDDIRALFEQDAKEIASAMAAGEFDTESTALSEMSHQEMLRLSSQIIHFIFSRGLFVAVLKAIGSMKWLTFLEAKLYSRIKSDNTLKTLLKDGEIYGTKPGGQWVVDRESVDSYYNKERAEAHITAGIGGFRG